MQRNIASVWSLVFVFAFASACWARTPPNVIVIFTDDQGDAGCFGAKDLCTPAIDGLAARGVRFTQFYAAGPICSPSRAGLLSGRYPWLAGMPGNAGSPPPETVDDLAQLESEPSLFAQQTTLAELFRGAGYATAHVGKWHLDHGPGSKPLDQGFAYSFGHMDGCIDNYSHCFHRPVANGDGPPLSQADKQWSLASLNENLGETRNYARQQPEIVTELQSLEK